MQSETPEVSAAIMECNIAFCSSSTAAGARLSALALVVMIAYHVHASILGEV